MFFSSKLSSRIHSLKSNDVPIRILTWDVHTTAVEYAHRSEITAYRLTLITGCSQSTDGFKITYFFAHTIIITCLYMKSASWHAAIFLEFLIICRGNADRTAGFHWYPKVPMEMRCATPKGLWSLRVENQIPRSKMAKMSETGWTTFSPQSPEGWAIQQWAKPHKET